MKKIISFKGIVLFLAAYFMICLNGITVYAETLNELEPNNTMETAQEIKATKVNSTEIANNSGIRPPNLNDVYGWGSSTDEDWYKVYLTIGLQYVTCASSPYNLYLYDSGNNLLLEKQHVNPSGKASAFPFEVTEEGYYYVKIISHKTSSYSLYVGTPIYGIGSCTINLGNVTMSGSDVNVKIDESMEQLLPNNSMVTSMTVRGVKSSNISGITVKNENKNLNIRLDNYTWRKDDLGYSKLPVKSPWIITFMYKKNAILAPQFNMYFVYPITGLDRDYYNIVIS